MKLRLLSICIFAMLITQACEIYEPYEDFTPPAIPKDIVMLNGDDRVDLFWRANSESDLAGYNIYVSDSYDGRYLNIGSSIYNNFADYDAVNGETYYYAVTSYDYNGNESELSFDVIYATPRPEGYNQSIFDYREFPNNSGYSFSKYSVFPFDDSNTDFFFENFEDDFYLNVWDDTDIQDMGSTVDIYDVEYAPVSGWSTTKDAVAVVGHTYVIWTWNNHFAKIRISEITPQRVVFDWAYQLVEGEPLLKGTRTSEIRGPLTRDLSR
ncbi:hypothetical protein ACFLSS_01590 [Bacteroidota bacterium]